MISTSYYDTKCYISLSTILGLLNLICPHKKNVKILTFFNYRLGITLCYLEICQVDISWVVNLSNTIYHIYFHFAIYFMKLEDKDIIVLKQRSPD